MSYTISQGVTFAKSEDELERKLYVRGTDVSFAEFIAYRDLRDETELSNEDLEKQLDEAANEADAARQELDELKSKVFDLYIKLQALDANDFADKTAREDLNHKLTDICGGLYEVCQ
jgi:hypothetical protein